MLKHKLISSLLLVVVTVSSFMSYAKPAQALFGVGDIVAVNVQDMVTNVLASAGVTMLKSVNERYTREFLNQAAAKYKIMDAQKYTQDLINDVYVNNSLKNMTLAEAYALKGNIQRLNGQPSPQGLDIINRKNARDNFNIYDVNQVNSGTEFYEFLSKTSDFVNTTPQGQQLLVESKAQAILASAKEAALNDLSSGQGYATSYNCRTSNFKPSNGEEFLQTNARKVRGTDGFYYYLITTSILNANPRPTILGMISKDVTGDGVTEQVVQVADTTNRVLGAINSCITGNPGSYVANTINSKIEGLFQNQIKPENYYSAFLGQMAGTLLSKRLDEMLLGKKNKSNNALQFINDDSTNLAPGQRTLLDDIYGSVNN